MPNVQIPIDAILNNGGVLDPLEFKRHRQVVPDGTALDGVFTTTWVLNIAGNLLFRLRGKLTAAGTLSFRYRRPPPKADQAYSAAVVVPHADVIVVANTEFSADITPGGESLLEIKWTPGGAGAVTFLDQMTQ